MNPPTNSAALPPMAGSASSWLFPEIEQEIRDDRSAVARQAAQRVRNEKRKAVEYLRKRDLQWLIDKLVDDGPSTDCRLMMALINRPLEDIGTVWVDLWSLWRVGKLWRVSQGIHPGAGEEFFLYGIRGVHPQNARAMASGSPEPPLK
jgi:hypothetical protein